MIALNATSRTTGRTKNHPLLSTVLFIRLASIHHPAIFRDLRMSGIEGDPDILCRDVAPFAHQEFELLPIAPTGPGLDGYDDIAGHGHPSPRNLARQQVHAG